MGPMKITQFVLISALNLLFSLSPLGIASADAKDKTPAPQTSPSPTASATAPVASPSPAASASAPTPSPSPTTSAPAPETSATPAPETSASSILDNPDNPELQSDTFKIMDVEVVGTEYKDAVQLAMFTKPGDEVDSLQLRDDIRRIYGLGYFMEVSATRKQVQGGYQLVVYVVENPVFKAVRIVNKPLIYKNEQLEALFREQIGKILNFNELRDTKDKIESLYREQGYVLANVQFLQTQLSEKEGMLTPDGVLELQVNEGVIEKILVEGNVDTKAHVILREMTLKPGDLFNKDVMQADIGRVVNTNYFENLNLEPKPGEKDPNHVILVIDLKERQTGSINIGAGFNNRDGLIGTFSVIKDNLLGEGRRLAVEAQFGLDVFGLFRGQNTFSQAQRTLLGRVDFFDPWMFEGRTSFGASLFSERIPLFFGQNATNLFSLNLANANGIIQSRSGVSLSLGRPLFGDFITSPWRGSLSFRAEQVGVTDLNRVPQPDLSISKRQSATDHIFSIGGSLSYDTRDFNANPRKGWFGMFSFEPVWGDAGYVKVTGNLSTYLGMTDWLTLAIGVRGGTYLGTNPPYEQFYSNGFNVIRGWPENGFLFGKNFMIGSVEARFPIVEPISGVLFLDLGEFFSENQGILGPFKSNLNQGLPFKYGVGLGVRLNTPMGPLRLDYGIRDFSKLGFSTLFDAGQIHFSIGQKF